MGMVGKLKGIVLGIGLLNGGTDFTDGLQGFLGGVIGHIEGVTDSPQLNDYGVKTIVQAFDFEGLVDFAGVDGIKLHHSRVRKFLERAEVSVEAGGRVRLAGQDIEPCGDLRD